MLGIKHLSQNISPDTCGIIWLTDDKLDYQSPGFYEFNYLLDGSIAKNINSLHSESQTSLFFGQNFGKSFFISHNIVKDKESLKQMYNVYKVANSALRENEKIYIFNRSKNTANVNILKELSKKYSQYQFENLNI